MPHLAPNATPYDVFYHTRVRTANGFDAMGLRARPAGAMSALRLRTFSYSSSLPFPLPWPRPSLAGPYVFTNPSHVSSLGWYVWMSFFRNCAQPP